MLTSHLWANTTEFTICFTELGLVSHLLGSAGPFIHIHGARRNASLLLPPFEVEGEGLVVADQQSLPFEGAGDAGGNDAQQARRFSAMFVGSRFRIGQ